MTNTGCHRSWRPFSMPKTPEKRRFWKPQWPNNDQNRFYGKKKRPKNGGDKPFLRYCEWSRWQDSNWRAAIFRDFWRFRNLRVYAVFWVIRFAAACSGWSLFAENNDQIMTKKQDHSHSEKCENSPIVKPIHIIILAMTHSKHEKRVMKQKALWTKLTQFRGEIIICGSSMRQRKKATHNLSSYLIRVNPEAERFKAATARV